MAAWPESGRNDPSGVGTGENVFVSCIIMATTNFRRAMPSQPPTKSSSPRARSDHSLNLGARGGSGAPRRGGGGGPPAAPPPPLLPPPPPAAPTQGAPPPSPPRPPPPLTATRPGQTYCGTREQSRLALHEGV